MSAIEDMLLKFTSGNDVAVQRAVVTLDEWRATYAEYMALQARVAELEKELKYSEMAATAEARAHDEARMQVDELIKERDGLLSQLPEGMKHCTIIFKECEKGHGWLTATNWVQHGCPKCELDRIVDEKHEFQRLQQQSSNLVSALHLEACQWRFKAEKAEQERDGLAAKCAELEAEIVGQRHKFDVLMSMSAPTENDAVTLLAKLKAEAVREACDKVVSDYRAVSFDKNDNLYLNIIALRDYANQIEGGA